MSEINIPFAKMEGLGNDFVIIDARPNSEAVRHLAAGVSEFTLTPAQARHIAARDNKHTGGCDQILIIREAQGDGDCFMQILNADGSEVEACGNGTRAVAAFLIPRQFGQCVIETLGGSIKCYVSGKISYDELQQTSWDVEINMGLPRFGWQDIPLVKKVEDTSAVELHRDLPPAFLVNVGNPHAVFFVDSNPYAWAEKYGAKLVNNELFKEGANIGFAQILNESILLQVYERGAGLTKSCGTGACAATIAATARKLPVVNRPDTGICVLFPEGGQEGFVNVSYREDGIYLIGSAIQEHAEHINEFPLPSANSERQGV